jgi:hypothetical protein
MTEPVTASDAEDARITELADRHVQQANIRGAINDCREAIAAIDDLVRVREVTDQLDGDTVAQLRRIRADKNRALDEAAAAAERFLGLIGACGDEPELMDRAALGAFVLAAAGVPTLGDSGA